MNYELTQSINDLQEHLRILKENLQNTNVELTKVLSNKDTAVLELEELSNEIVACRESIKESIKKNDELISLQSKKSLDNYNESEILLAEAKLKSDELLKESIEKKEELIASISKLVKDKAEIVEELSNAEEAYPILKDKNEQLLISIDYNTKLSNDLSQVVSDLESKRNELDYKLSQEEIFFDNEIKEIHEQIAIEREKIQSPMEFLNQSEFELKKREKNLEILKLRFKTKFEKVFPNQDIKI